MPTIEERRATALATIEAAKKKGLGVSYSAHNVLPEPVKSALKELVRLDDSATYAPEAARPRSDQLPHDSHCKATFGANDGGFTINGEFVPITSPPSAGDHDSNLGWSEPNESADLERNQQFTTAGEFLGDICRWFAESRELSAIALKAMAIVVVVRPDLCEGTQNAVAARFGFCRAAMQKRCRELREMAGSHYQARCQRNPSDSDAARERAINQHRKAGHKIQSEGKA